MRARLFRNHGLPTTVLALSVSVLVLASCGSAATQEGDVEIDESDPLASLDEEQQEALCEEEWNKAKNQVGVDGWCRWYAHVRLVEFAPVTDQSARDRCTQRFEECQANPATCEGGFGADQCSATVQTARTCQRAFIDRTAEIISNLPSCDTVSANFYEDKSKEDFRPSDVAECDKLQSTCPDFYEKRYENAGERTF